MHVETDTRSRSRFVWGIALAWLPAVLILGPAILIILRSISASKATGLGAIAGGLFGGVMTFGLAAIGLSEIAAVVLLSRSFSPGHSMRGLVSVLSICSALLLIGILGLLIWSHAVSPLSR
jgi:hypothetical protein